MSAPLPKRIAITVTAPVRLPVPRLAGNGFQVGEDQVEVFAVGDTLGGRQGLVGVLPGPVSAPGDRAGPGQRLVGEGQIEVADVLLPAEIENPAGVGTAYEFATGQRLGSGDFEGGKSGAVRVLGNLGFTVQHQRRAAG